MAHGSFATVITCMDGRVQEPVSKWMKEEFGVDYVDTITAAGPDRLLAIQNPRVAPNIRERVGISVEKHGSKVVACIAHDDCAGNPVSKDKHLEHLAAALRVIESWGWSVRLLGLWVNEEWQVEVISDTNPGR
jgi:carbonic anhydrase